ncbi:MAG: carboxypeptidase regulatory-like domain-containing protein [Dehalococcoidia bacterium]|nr:carboxypeptidase regulatory-like domain-containing protein [Planctomycetota bacterium]MCB9492582.1 carboxypeptidase regulatory-like domain-containing protein [Dehalococcoidia bacterium]
MKRHAPWLLLAVLVLLVGGSVAVQWLHSDGPPSTELHEQAGLSPRDGEVPTPPGLTTAAAVGATTQPAVGFRLPTARTGWVIDHRSEGVPGVRVHLEAKAASLVPPVSRVRIGSGRAPLVGAHERWRCLETFLSGVDGRFEIPERWSAVRGRLVADPSAGHTGASCELDAMRGAGLDPVLQVAPAGVVRGRAIRVGAAPPRGRIACVARVGVGRGPRPVAWSTLDAQGGFEVLAPGAEPVDFRIEDAGGAVWSSLPASREADGTYTVRMPSVRPGALGGFLTWSDGSPATQIEVDLHGPLLGGGTWTQTVRSRGNGEWAPTDAPQLVEVFATARATAYLRVSGAAIVATDEQDVMLDLVFPPSRTVTLHVQSYEREPLEGVRVLHSGLHAALVMTDSAGRIELEGVRSDQGARFEILAPGWGTADGSDLSVSLPADGGTSPRDLFVVLGPLARQAIEVRDAKGAAVAGATVLLVPSDDAGVHHLMPSFVGVYEPAVTDRAGRCDVSALPPTAGCDVHVRQPGVGDHVAHDFIPPAGEVLLVTVPVGGPVFGRVVEPLGDPVPHMPLRLTGPGGAASPTMTSLDGRFRFERTTAGPCTLRADPHLGGPWVDLEVGVPGDRPAVGLDLGDVRVESYEDVLVGWVESSTGACCVGVDVAIRTRDGRMLGGTRSRDDGWFYYSLQGDDVEARSRLHPIELVVQATGGEPVTAHVPGPAVRLVRGAGQRALRFHLTTSEGGSLVTGELEVSFSSMRQVRGWQFPIERGMAHVDLPESQDRPLLVRVRSARDEEGRATLADWSDTIVPGDHEEVRLVVPLGRTLRGRVMALDGETPVPGLVQFSTGSPASDHVLGFQRRVHTPGEFEIEGLPDVDGYLTLRSNQWVLEGTGLVRARPGGEPLVLMARRVRNLSVALTTPEGAPVPGAILEAIANSDEAAMRPARAVTNAQGRATLRELPHAPLRVSVRPASERKLGNLHLDPVEVEPDVGHIDLVMQRAPSLSGRVVRSGDGDVRGFRVEVVSLVDGDSRNPLLEYVREDGSFLVGPLRPGPHRVRLALWQGARASAWQEVTAPAEDIELSLADGGDATVHVEGQHRRLDVVLELADGTQERLMEVRQEASPKRTLVVPVRHEGGALIVVDVDSGQHARVEEVRPGDDVTLRLARGRPTRVRLPHVPWPFRPWSVDAESRDGMRRVRGVIDDAARFVTFQGLPPGRWTIEARVGVDRTYVFRAIDVEPGQQDVLLALVESDLAAK